MTASDPEPVVVWAVVRPDGVPLRLVEETQRAAQQRRDKLNEGLGAEVYTVRRYTLTPAETSDGE